LKDPKETGLFNDFEFEEEILDEAEGLLSKLYISVKNNDKEEDVMTKLQRNLDDEALINKQKNLVCDLLIKEVNIFTRTVSDLGQSL
ncbi:9739_t:CDS:2, partial [Racocetra persica]